MTRTNDQPRIKYPYQLSVDWSFMRIMDIEDYERPGYVYLRRLIVFKTPLGGLYVHWIWSPDGQRDPHNHPMNFWSFILRGGYIEYRYQPDEVRKRRMWSIARTTRQNFHRIVALARYPTITILFTGRRDPEGWGFLTKNGYVPAAKYLEQLGASK